MAATAFQPPGEPSVTANPFTDGRFGVVPLALAVAMVLGVLIRERRDHAVAMRGQTAAHAVTAERLRIARDLHDMVAHSIGIIAIQSGAARRVMGTQPDKAREALAAIEATSQETLAGLRHMLGALRQASAGAADRVPVTGLADGNGWRPRRRRPGFRSKSAGAAGAVRCRRRSRYPRSASSRRR